uniref:Uncharacterized protein n=1 Tax=Tanacetum cinerariifolium TaxID=118510 RepID=A0A699GQM6_TANCI|nr:hypothetical protein [Tanacetum cinerariifolium]
MAQQVVPAAQLVLRYHTIGRCNNYAVLQSIPRSHECKIVRKILLDHLFGYALTATADVPVVSTPIAHNTPTLTAASPQGNKRKQTARKSSSPRKSYKLTIKKKKQSTTLIPPPETVLSEDETFLGDLVDEEEIENMVEGDEDGESYGIMFADSMINNDVDDSGTKIEPGSHKEHLENVTDDDEEIKKEKNDE